MVDTSVESFRRFLRYFYSRGIHLSDGNLSDVLYLGEKYEVKECRDECSEYILQNLQESTAILYYEIAVLYELSLIAEICEHIIRSDSKQVLQSENFLHCEQSTLRRLLCMDHLSCAEIDVFGACMAWAAEACKKAYQNPYSVSYLKAELGDCLYLIRFPTMPTADILKVSLQEGLIELELILELCQHSTLKKELKLATKYPMNPRTFPPPNSAGCSAIFEDYFNDVQLESVRFKMVGKFCQRAQAANRQYEGSFRVIS